MYFTTRLFTNWSKLSVDDAIKELEAPEFSLTITGDEENNPIIGTEEDDVIEGLGGADFLDGQEGNDDLMGGDGDDVIVGREGDDRIYGGAGNDRLFGSEGDDEIYAGDGDDFISEGRGNDRDLIVGGAGNDTIEDFGGADIIEGGSGNDTIRAASFDNGTDWYNGGPGIDTVIYTSRSIVDVEITDQDSRGVFFVTNENGVRDGIHRMEFIQFSDVLVDLSQPLPTVVRLGDGGETASGLPNERNFIVGGDGDDSITGGDLADSINGGAGDDFIDTLGGGSFDPGDRQYVNGGDGNDTIFSGGFGIDEIDGGSGNDFINVWSTVAIILDDGGEDQVFASGTNFTLVVANGDDGANDLYGGPGNGFVVFVNTSVFDVEIGENELGNITITHASGAIDEITGFQSIRFSTPDSSEVRLDVTFGLPNIGYVEAGIDFFGTFESDFVTGTDQQDFIYGQAGQDTLAGGLGNDRLFGQTGDDILHGGDGSDFINGGGDNDSLYGDDGNDVLVGQNGNDRLYDGRGDDIVRAGSGDDQLFTSAYDFGNDYFSGGNGQDTVIYTDGFAEQTFSFSLNNQGRLLVTDIYGNVDTFANVEFMQVQGIQIDVQQLILTLQGGQSSMSLSELEDMPFVETVIAAPEQNLTALANAGHVTQSMIDEIVEAELANLLADVDMPDFDIWV